MLAALLIMCLPQDNVHVTKCFPRMNANKIRIAYGIAEELVKIWLAVKLNHN